MPEIEAKLSRGDTLEQEGNVILLKNGKKTKAVLKKIGRDLVLFDEVTHTSARYYDLPVQKRNWLAPRLLEIVSSTSAAPKYKRRRNYGKKRRKIITASKKILIKIGYVGRCFAIIPHVSGIFKKSI